jgi:creatinine amidohydrolase/Fe(II)-dependent formamide hydrolase-like protein
VSDHDVVRDTDREHVPAIHEDEWEVHLGALGLPGASDRSVRGFRRVARCRELIRLAGEGTYSPSGVWGDATLATREKWRIVVERLVEAIAAEVCDLARGRLLPRAP